MCSCSHDRIRLQTYLSFSMRAMIRITPLLGALVLSTAPVDAIETIEELDKACYATVESALLR